MQLVQKCWVLITASEKFKGIVVYSIFRSGCKSYNTGIKIIKYGIVTVVKTGYNDPLDDNFSVVDVQTKISLNNPVHLSTIKATEELKNLAIIKQPRLSVSPINQEEFNKIIELSNTSFTL